MVRNLEKIHNRRKAVVYVSNGYDFNPFEGARYGDPNIIGEAPAVEFYNGLIRTRFEQQVRVTQISCASSQS